MTIAANCGKLRQIAPNMSNMPKKAEKNINNANC